MHTEKRDVENKKDIVEVLLRDKEGRSRNY
jgi:hypothetical protein